MKFFATILGAALVATGVSAQQAVVKNNCASTTIFVQSYPFDGSAAGALTTLAPGETFAEDFRSSGSVSFPPR
jgi:hypothetical protein